MDADPSRNVSSTARKRLGVADHILTQTYPLLQDPKLLLAVLQNIYGAVSAGIDALLEHEADRVPQPLPQTFEARLALFHQHLAPHYAIPRGFLRFVGELRETIKEHEESPVEFARKESFVICDEGYRVKTLTVEQLTKYLERAKAFIAFMEEKVKE